MAGVAVIHSDGPGSSPGARRAPGPIGRDAAHVGICDVDHVQEQTLEELWLLDQELVDAEFESLIEECWEGGGSRPGDQEGSGDADDSRLRVGFEGEGSRRAWQDQNEPLIGARQRGPPR